MKGLKGRVAGGERIEVDLVTGEIRLGDRVVATAKPLPRMLIELLESGGLKRRLREEAERILGRMS